MKTLFGGFEGKRSVRCVVLCAAALTAFSAAGYCGANSFAEILTAEPSVRANGMGNAYTAADGDVFGAYYNPAHTVKTAKIGFVFQRGYADDNTGAVGIALPMGPFQLGLSTLYYDGGNMDLYSPGGYLGSVKAEKDYVGLVSLACKMGPLSLGVNGKYVREELFEAVSAGAFTGDAGILLETPLINLGAAAQNLTGGFNFGNEMENFRKTLRAGAYKQFGGDALSLSAAFDLVKTDGMELSKRLGAEVSIAKLIALRGGYQFGASGGSQNGAVAFGFGARLGALAVDYALVPNKDLGATHKAGLTIGF